MSERPRLRQGRTKNIPGTVEVVFADEWDDLCDMADQLAEALRPFAAAADRACMCATDGHYVCPWHKAKDTLKSYEDGDR